MQPGRRSSALKFQINAGSACPCLLHWGCGSKAVWNSSDFVGPSVPKLESNKLLKVWLCPLLLFLLKAFRPFHEHLSRWCVCALKSQLTSKLFSNPSLLHCTLQNHKYPQKTVQIFPKYPIPPCSTTPEQKPMYVSKIFGKDPSRNLPPHIT